MSDLTWKDFLKHPTFLMTFLEGFLMLFVPVIGGGNALDGGGTIDLKSWPSPQTMLAGVCVGMYGGIRSIRNLMSPTPRLGGEERRSPESVVVPSKPGGG